MILITVLLGSIGTTVGLVWALRERDRARRMYQFLADALEHASPERPEGASTTVREALAGCEGEIAKHFGGTPDLRARLEYAVGSILVHQGEPAVAARLFRSALATDEALYGPRAELTLDDKHMLALAEYQLGQYRAAAEVFHSVAEEYCRLRGPDDKAALQARFQQAQSLLNVGESERGEALLAEVSDRLFKLESADERLLTSVANAHAAQLVMKGQFADAARQLSALYERCKQRFGERHRTSITVLYNLGTALHGDGQEERAQRLLERVVALDAEVRAPDDPDALTHRSGLAQFYFDLGQYERAAELHADVLARRRKVLGQLHPSVIRDKRNHSAILLNCGHLDQAEALAREAVQGMTHLGRPTSELLDARNHLASILARAGKFEEAAQTCKAVWQEAQEQQDHWVPYYQTAYGNVLAKAGRVEEGLPHLEAGVRGLAELVGERHYYTREAARCLIEAYDKLIAGQPDSGYAAQAAQWRAKLEAWQAATQPATQP